jgi:hypothetical protein
MSIKERIGVLRKRTAEVIDEQLMTLGSGTMPP